MVVSSKDPRDTVVEFSWSLSKAVMLNALLISVLSAVIGEEKISRVVEK